MALTAEPSVATQPLDATAPSSRFEGLSPRQLFFREIKKDKLAIASFWFIVLMVLAVVLIRVMVGRRQVLLRQTAAAG